MIVRNKTNYDTRTLKALLVAVHAAEGGKRGRLKTWKRLCVTIKHSRCHGYTGFAWYSGLKATLCVPKDGILIRKFAELWRHELWHLYGIRHSDYPPSIRYCRLTEWSLQFVDRFDEFLGPEIDLP